jgi:hypothetical protein
MDLNQAFAKHWDRKNPSDFVKACDQSRQLREDEERRKQNIAKLDELTRSLLSTKVNEQLLKSSGTASPQPAKD